MNNISTSIQNREKQLEILIAKKKAALKNAPKGHLRICTRPSSRKMYYHIVKNGETNGKYIRKKDLDLARRLAQKDYDLAVIRSAEKEMKALKKACLLLPKRTAEDLYEDSLSDSRKDLIVPVRPTDSQFIRDWLNEPYTKKAISEDVPEYYTDLGERIRSKSELIIANKLVHMNIPYKYECPLLLDSNRTIHPDFTLLNVAQRKIYYLEHLGKMDDPVYCSDALERIQLYQKNGFFPGESLLLTFETNQHPLNIKGVEQILKHYLL